MTQNLSNPSVHKFGAASGITSDSDLRGVSVDRETHTSAGKSIDLLIETGSLIIAVENKLRAKPYNDFDEYTKYTKDRAGDARKKAVLILLALNEIGTTGQLADSQPITYQQFLDRLSSAIDPAPATANTGYVAYMKIS
jgi:hypothetical protein